MMNKYIAVIQARMGSTRFPGKVMQPLGDSKTIIEFITKRLKFSKKIDKIVLAIPNTKENEMLKVEAYRIGIECVTGDVYNVASRVLNAFYGELDKGTRFHYLKATFDEKTIMVDITADCPLICPYLIDYGIEMFEKFQLDYVSNIITRSWPDGLDFQIYDPSLLYNLLYPISIIQDKHKEHTGWNIINCDDSLSRRLGRNIKKMNIGATNEICFHPEYSITLDTPEDYEVIKKIHNILSSMFKQNNSYASIAIMNLLHSNPGLLDKNKNIERKIPGV